MTDKRGPGRPLIGREICLRLDDHTLHAVDRLAHDNYASRSEVLRELITESLTIRKRI